MKRFVSYSSAIILLFIGTQGNAQVTTGGNMSVNYNNGYLVDISPIIGYKLNKFNFGFSPFFAYNQTNKANFSSSFGAHVFAQFTVVNGIFLHAEIEAINAKVNLVRKWMIGLPVGIGYEYQIAKNTKAQGSILYDVLLDKDSPKENPEVRGGIVYTF